MPATCKLTNKIIWWIFTNTHKHTIDLHSTVMCTTNKVSTQTHLSWISVFPNTDWFFQILSDLFQYWLFVPNTNCLFPILTGLSQYWLVTLNTHWSLSILTGHVQYWLVTLNTDWSFPILMCVWKYCRAFKLTQGKAMLFNLGRHPFRACKQLIIP